MPTAPLRAEAPSPLSARKRLFIVGWAALILLIYAGVAWLAFSMIHGEKLASIDDHRTRMTPGLVERGQTPPDPLPESGSFVPVTIGLYLDGIDAFSIRESMWTSTFYVWFRWQGDRALDPGRDFRLVDGRIERRDLVEEYYGPDGTNYQRYRVIARMTKFFNTTRVPLDDHMLNLYIEDARLDVTRLRYVADPATNVSSRVRVSGYRILASEATVKPHTYRSAYGDPRVAPGTRTTFSEFTYGLSIKRDGVGVYVKLFVGLFAGLALAFASYGLRASDAGPRFSMLAGAYFGAVANSYLAGTLVPSSGQFGLVEYVTFTGLFTIFVSLIATITSVFIWNRLGDRELSRVFDLATAGALAVGYIGVNLLMPLSA